MNNLILSLILIILAGVFYLVLLVVRKIHLANPELQAKQAEKARAYRDKVEQEKKEEQEYLARLRESEEYDPDWGEDEYE